MSLLADLPDAYRLILCDLWGCVHDGHAIFPGAAERLGQWAAEGRTIVLVTNAPRSGDAVRTQLDALGLPRSAYHGVLTAGEAGLAAVAGRPVGFVGTAADRADLEARGLVVAERDFDELACAGLDEHRREVADYVPQLKQWAARDMLLHCLNPDRVVVHVGQRMVCAGALADAYAEMGGCVEWHGKPFPDIYRLALRMAGDPPPEAVLAIGDGLATDMLGAARMGFGAVFVQGGIHAGEPFPNDFGQRHGLDGWAPVAVVQSLAD